MVLDALVALLITLTALGGAVAATGSASRYAAAAYEQALRAATELGLADPEPAKHVSPTLKPASAWLRPSLDSRWSPC